MQNYSLTHGGAKSYHSSLEASYRIRNGNHFAPIKTLLPQDKQLKTYKIASQFQRPIKEGKGVCEHRQRKPPFTRLQTSLLFYFINIIKGLIDFM